MLRVAAIAVAVLAWLPAGTISAHFSQLVRSSIRLGMLPQYPSASFFFDSCATLRLNKLPDFCERIYKLSAPDPALPVMYPKQVAEAGWELVDYRVAQGYDWYARRTMNLECFMFRTWLWGVNETLIVAIYDERVIFLAATDSVEYCSRYMRMRR